MKFFSMFTKHIPYVYSCWDFTVYFETLLFNCIETENKSYIKSYI